MCYRRVYPPLAAAETLERPLLACSSQPPPDHPKGRSVFTGLEGCIPHRTGAMQDAGYQLRRTLIPRRW
jgi:hypothetical protein